MVWLNEEHINTTYPPGVLGGSMCTCDDCIKARANNIDRKKSPHELYEESEGDAHKYLELMIKHGYARTKGIAE